MRKGESARRRTKRQIARAAIRQAKKDAINGVVELATRQLKGSLRGGNLAQTIIGDRANCQLFCLMLREMLYNLRNPKTRASNPSSCE